CATIGTVTNATNASNATGASGNFTVAGTFTASGGFTVSNSIGSLISGGNGSTFDFGTGSGNRRGMSVHHGGTGNLFESYWHNGSAWQGAFHVERDGRVRANVYDNFSDGRLKKNVRRIESSLDKVCKLEGVRFEWKERASTTPVQIGLIAQNVEKVFPETVSQDKDGIKSVSYGSLIAPVI